ncbi:MAG TPA: Uma2 family endonuclease [Bryobacteraceae bacterium]|nr:Uma2 family endonuclease [Bryobacteraceae bacterium]
MATTGALLTVDEFRRLPEHEGERVELVEGEVVTMAGANFPHERVKARVIRLLVLWLAQSPLGEVFSETMYRLDEHSSLQPDVSVLLNERIGPEIEGLYPGAPDIAIEIVSSETAAYLQNKIDLYLEHGSRAVWVFYSKPPRVLIHRASGLVAKLHGNQILEDPDVLPGFGTPVSAIFEGL